MSSEHSFLKQLGELLGKKKVKPTSGEAQQSPDKQSLAESRPSHQQASSNPSLSENLEEDIEQDSDYQDCELEEPVPERIREIVDQIGQAMHLELVTNYLNMAYEFAQAGDIEAAQQAYLSAMEIDAVCAETRAVTPILPGQKDATPSTELSLMSKEDWWNSMGLALVELEQYEEALTCYDRGLEIAPRNLTLWTNKGMALLRLGRYKEALVWYDHGLVFAPHDCGLWMSRSSVLYMLKRYEEALVALEEALAYSEPHPEIIPSLWKNKGGVLAALERYEEALVCYDQGLELAPHRSDLWKNKGLALKALGRKREAEACFRLSFRDQ
jgi:tetratricopeptide (TPR) repeat protein